ncbi:MAG: GTP pyrophosphokinase family protein [Atopobiaceae bacterium]|nr:GTP pyrophosphokinase family protein [Atopobiaceae bacterium]
MEEIVEATGAADIYGGERPQMEAALDELVQTIKGLRSTMTVETGFDPIEHILARVKSEESMREKCRRKGLPETSESALHELYDGLGIRVVCSFLSDVYALRDHLASDPSIQVLEERDYIRHAKPNGYRSYHMIVRTHRGYYAEVQLRTISMDTWAALEHHLHYKKRFGGNQKLIVQELKRCADELASTDVSMQTIRDMILSEED